jgi:hypothetical protein
VSFFIDGGKSSTNLQQIPNSPARIWCSFAAPYFARELSRSAETSRTAHRNLIRANKLHKRIAVDFDVNGLSMSVPPRVLCAQKRRKPSNLVFN